MTQCSTPENERFADEESSVGSCRRVRRFRGYRVKRDYLAILAVAFMWCLSGCTTLEPLNDPPLASFSMVPAHGAAPLEVQFDAGASYDPDGIIESYTWSFGDGASGQGRTVTHVYQSAGFYSVRLTVRDNDGDSRGVSHSVQATQETIASYYVTVDGVTGEFEQNEYAATLKYDGSYIEVSGYVRSIGIDLRDKPYVALVGTSGASTFFAPGVNCYFEQEGPHPGLAELREGDYVTIVAEFSFYSSLFSTVYLEKSRIQ